MTSVHTANWFGDERATTVSETVVELAPEQLPSPGSDIELRVALPAPPTVDPPPDWEYRWAVEVAGRTPAGRYREVFPVPNLASSYGAVLNVAAAPEAR
jgi:hypothetical protein